MIYLNDEAILYAISMCRRRRGYKVGIVTASMRDIPYIRDMIMSCLREYRMESSPYFYESRMNPDIDIRFENGSQIRLIPHSGQARGHKAHLLVVDENVDYERLQEIYRPIECLEDIEARRRYYDRVDMSQWFSRNWFTAPTSSVKEDIEEVSEDEFLKVIS